MNDLIFQKTYQLAVQMSFTHKIELYIFTFLFMKTSDIRSGVFILCRKYGNKIGRHMMYRPISL